MRALIVHQQIVAVIVVAMEAAVLLPNMMKTVTCARGPFAMEDEEILSKPMV